MPDPLVMSSSSMSTMLNCGLQWQFAYVERIKSPPSVRALIGTAAHHAILDTNLAQKIESKVDLPVDDVLDSYSTAFDQEVPSLEKIEEPIGSAKDSGAKLVKLFQKGSITTPPVAPSIQPLAVEKQANYTIGGHEYSTFIDLVKEGPGGGKVVDELKTSLRTGNGANHMLQVIGATLAERQNTGEVEEGMQLSTLIRTQTPKYHTIKWGPLTTPTIQVFANQIDTANKMAQAGLFPANGLKNGACSWCGYTNICPAFRAAFGNRKP